MRGWRLALRLPAAVIVTAVLAFVPLVVRTATRGSLRPWALAGSRCCGLWGRLMCGILGIRVVVEGEPPRGRFLLTANHTSYVDIWVLASICPSIFVAKREIASWPLFGWIARWSGTLFVDRERAKDVVRVGREMAARLEAGIPVTLFPEGKASRGASVLPFQPPLLEPAARLGVPCYAAALTYDTPGTADAPAATVCWYDHGSFPRHVARLMALPRIEARVSIAAEPVVAADRKILAQRLWDETAARFVPVRQDASA